MADIKDNKPYTITIGTDNRPGDVEGEYHVQFKPDIMNVTFGEQEDVAKEFGGTMRVTNGQEWADFYREDEAVKFAEKVVGMNQKRELQARFDAFKAKHGEEPLYAEVTIRWKDDGTEKEDIIKLSDDIDERDDDKVFFNVTGLNDLKSLINPDNGEDFYIFDVQNITFQPKSLFLNDEKAVTVEQIQEKAVKLFGNNFEFDYWNETQAGTKIDRIDLGEMPDTISIDKLEIKDGKLSLYSNDIASDVDLQALDDIELSKVDLSLDEIKSFLDAQTLLTGVNDKLRYLLPEHGDHIFINEDLTIQRPDKTIRVFEVTHSLLVDTNEDVFVCGTTNGGFRLESLTSDELQKLNNILNEKKYNIFLSSNKEKDLVGRYQAAGMGNGTQLWPDRGTLGVYQAYAFKDNKILVFKDADDSKGVLLSSLPHEEQKYIMDSIGSLLDRHLITQERNFAEAKAQLFATILEARKDLGNKFSIDPTEITENGSKNVITEILPDFESPFEDQNIIGGVSHLKDEDCVHNLALCLENVNDAEALDKAVHEAHVKHLEQGAKQSIHDRIVTPSARRFTPDQVDILNRYHQVVVPDKPAGEVFKELLQEVAQDPDVARKPEKWVTDTAKELDGLAEGITRDQVRGLHK